MGADPAQRDEDASRLPGCEHRSAEWGSLHVAEIRPSDRRPAWHFCAGARLGAIQRLWAVASLADLYTAQPILCRAGGRARVLAGPLRPEQYLPEHFVAW